MSTQQALTAEKAEQLIRLLTDGLVNIKDTTGEFLLKLDDGSIIDTKGWQGWEWTHGIALTALYHHSAIHPSSESAQYSLKTALDWFESQYKITSGKGAPKNINTMSPFYSLSSFLADGLVTDEKWLAWCGEWAEWVMNELPRTPEGGFQHITYSEVNKDQMWDDTLMMTVIPLAKIGLLLNKPHYVQEAKYQFLLHINYLMDAPSGLWFHGWEFTPNEPLGGHNFARALWARGNCWVTVAIPLFISILDLQGDDPLFRHLVSVLRRQVDALSKLQDPVSGLWHTLLIDPTSYVESSATAGFAAGIYMGIRMGILDQKYLQTATKALDGVIANILPSGELENTSFGTGMGRNLQFYHDIPITSMPYGQALAMLALVEWERLQGAAAK